MIHTMLFILTAFVVWVISLYIHPFKACRRCKGTGRRTTGRNRSQPCARCQGTGRVQRIGARIAHRTALSLRAEYGPRRRSRKNI